MKTSRVKAAILCISLLFSCEKDDNINDNSKSGISATNFTSNVDENTSVGFSLGMLSSTVPDNSAIDYTLTNQSVSGALALSSSGELTIADATAFDYEVNQKIIATYTVKSGDESETKNITITINNIKDEPFMYKVKPVLFNGDYLATIGGSLQIGLETLVYNFTVDWGDGSAIETITDINDVKHVYPDDNLYTISVFGDIPNINTGVQGLSLVKEVVQWGEVEWKYLANALADNPDLVITATDTPDLSNAESSANMFENCTNLNTGNFNDWDLSNVTNLYEMFKNCSRFNVDLSKLDVSNVTFMGNMFWGCQDFNQDISSWDVRKVTNMANMFFSALTFNQNIGGWQTDALTNIGGMFSSAVKFNQDIGDWDVSKVTTMEVAFYNADAFNQDISNWDVGNVTNMSQMFFSNNGFNQDLSNWNVDQVTNCSEFASFSSLSFASQPNFTNCTK